MFKSSCPYEGLLSSMCVELWVDAFWAVLLLAHLASMVGEIKLINYLLQI